MMKIPFTFKIISAIRGRTNINLFMLWLHAIMLQKYLRWLQILNWDFCEKDKRLGICYAWFALAMKCRKHKFEKWMTLIFAWTILCLWSKSETTLQNSDCRTKATITIDYCHVKNTPCFICNNVIYIIVNKEI